MPFVTPSGNFSNFFQGWNRLESRSRRDDFGYGLKAPVGDGLWQLGRMWQVGELRAEDAGTPIDVRVAYENIPLDEVRLGDGSFTALGDVPLEVLVEREAVDWNWRMRVRAGQQFERIVRNGEVGGTGPGELIEEVRLERAVKLPETDSAEWLETDETSRRFVRFMAARGAIDGKLLLEPPSDSSFSSIPQEILDALKTWFDRLYSQGPSRWSASWKPEDLDYEFALKPVNPKHPGPLVASSYRNGTIDWHTFTLADHGEDAPEDDIIVHLTPTHAVFAGMPARRWWEFEDASVNLGDLSIVRTDVTKLMLVNFALLAGDDSFVVPLAARGNSLVRVRTLCVRDCFGMETNIPRARDVGGGPLETWEMFALTSNDGIEEPGDFLYVPPPTGSREESPPLEEIRFVRDEGANMVWAIEHIVPNALGNPVRGHEAHLEYFRRGGGAEASEPEAPEPEVESAEGEENALPPSLKYVMATSVPHNWIPFVPLASENVVNGIPRRSVRLRRGEMIATDKAGHIRIAPLSRLLDPEPGAAVEWIHEEAVGRSGTRVELYRQRVRSPDGGTYLWLGRKVGVGKGEGASGLRFDFVEGR